MTTVLGISGSLRARSYNTALLKCASELMPAGATLEIATLHGIPLYDGDAEDANGLPPAVADLKQRITAADGLLLATPEYNGSMPGVMKNALDWLSRPPADLPKVFAGRPVAVIGASPGGLGTVLAQSAWWPVLRNLNVVPWFGGRILVSSAHKVFDADGRLVDEGLRDQLTRFLAGFADFAGGVR